MGTDDKLNAIHTKIGEISTDIKWIIKAQAEDQERIRLYKIAKRTNTMWAFAIIVPIMISVLTAGSIFAFGVVKNVDILTALHKPQMEMFQIGGKK